VEYELGLAKGNADPIDVDISTIPGIPVLVTTGALSGFVDNGSGSASVTVDITKDAAEIISNSKVEVYNSSNVLVGVSLTTPNDDSVAAQVITFTGLQPAGNYTFKLYTTSGDVLYELASISGVIA
jgi:hypothetical protein